MTMIIVFKSTLSNENQWTMEAIETCSIPSKEVYMQACALEAGPNGIVDDS